jgi:hypothetical protein
LNGSKPSNASLPNSRPQPLPPNDAALIKALVHAVDGEQRFGRFEGSRPELNQRWEQALGLLREWLDG